MVNEVKLAPAQASRPKVGACSELRIAALTLLTRDVTRLWETAVFWTVMEGFAAIGNRFPAGTSLPGFYEIWN